MDRRTVQPHHTHPVSSSRNRTSSSPHPNSFSLYPSVWLSHLPPLCRLLRRALVLDSAPLSSFVSTSALPPCPPLLHALRTTTSSALTPLPPSVSPLPPPNLLPYLSSSILIHCELSSLPCTLLVSYASPHFFIESIDAFHALQPLLPSGVRLQRRGAGEYEREWKRAVQGMKEGVKGKVGPGGGWGAGSGAGLSSSFMQGLNSDLFL